MKGKSSKIGNDLGTPSETYSVRLGVDSSTFPFQEWSDEEVRAENWKSIVTVCISGYIYKISTDDSTKNANIKLPS